MSDLHDELWAAGTEQRRVEELEAEVNRLRAAIREHRDQRGDDRCWLDDVKLYGVLGEGFGSPAPGDTTGPTTLPPKDEFLKSCARYWEQRQIPADRRDSLPVDCMTITQLSAEIERLRVELAASKEDHAELRSWINEALTDAARSVGIDPDGMDDPTALRAIVAIAGKERTDPDV